jgi:hypothetical protein
MSNEKREVKGPGKCTSLLCSSYEKLVFACMFGIFVNVMKTYETGIHRYITNISFEESNIILESYSY